MFINGDLIWVWKSGRCLFRGIIVEFSADTGDTRRQDNRSASQNSAHLPLLRFFYYNRQNSILPSCMRLYPEVSGLAAWGENCKWYSSLPPGAAVSLFCESV
jgi:hypothetical protein